MIKTRYAPSPTGYSHVGGIRTALTSYLIAKKAGGNFILRIEDTDQKRLIEGAIESILSSLYWVGIIPDEGLVLDNNNVAQKGENGPYIQSQRLDIYKKYADEIVEKGHAYHCFCTAERLEELRVYQQKNKLPTGYDGHCRDLDPEEVKKRLSAGESSVIRMKMPREGETIFTDLIRGEVRFKNELIDDQVLMKTDGFPTYHLAVVVDDHLMGITHAVRAEEWLPSTPKQLQLFKCFGWEAPAYAHVPQLVNKDRTKLSKRQGDVAVEDYIKKGYLPEAVLNFIALLGWNPGTEQEIFTMDQLIKEFDVEKIGKSGAYFNLEKLNWYNQQYIKKLTNEELAERAKQWLDEVGLDKVDKNLLVKAVGLEKERIVTLAELPAAIKFVLELPNYEGNLLVWKKSSADEVKKILPEVAEFLQTIDVNDWNKDTLQAKVGEWIKTKGYQNGSVLWPMRVALSGQDKSPGPFEIAEVLGRAETIKRIQTAIQKL